MALRVGPQAGQRLSSQGNNARLDFRVASEALEKNLSRVIDSLEPTAFDSERQRFELWGTNVGLFRGDYGSLDYQLRDDEVIRSFTATLLANLIEAINESQSDFLHFDMLLIGLSHKCRKSCLNRGS